jgi:Zn-dependent M28 family amino/carboxypeptidase
MRAAAPTLLAALLAAPATRAAAPATAPVTLSAAEKAAGAQITPALLRSHIRFLADDLLEGRGPATRGDRLAQLYIASELEALGLQPGAADGTYFQPFDVVGVASHAPETLTARKGGQTVDLKFHDDYIAVSGLEAPRARLADAEIVFVGYGIVAPEFGWDDYKGMDLKGKVLLMMNNDPEDDPQLFGGKTRLYYGRWDYKYDQAAKTGAAGAIIIHTTPSAGYGWQVIQSSWTGEQFVLPHEGGPQLQVKAWVTDDSAKRLAKLGGQDLDALRAAAQKRDFRPVPLGVTVSLDVTADVSRKQTANVIAKLPGSDPALAPEVVLYTAHHDHLGMRTDAKPGEDAIYNGAVDNASGVAALLAIAKAAASMPQAPRRSLVFAAVAAEEQGLLGAKYLAAHPPLPPGRIAANINMDSMAIFGRTRDLTMIGLGKSSLDEWARGIAALQGRTVVPDQFPDKGFFYRSDQFAFARIGVPAAYFDPGTEVVGKPAGWGKAQAEEWEAKHYHQVSDELRPDWNFEGMVEDARFDLYLGLKVANQTALPAWKPGDEFEAARKKALEEARSANPTSSH